MKKLKCDSCGGTIEIEEGNEFATCPFCKTKYKLNETKNIYIKLDDNTKEILEKSFGRFNRVRKLIMIPAIIIFITIFVIAIISFININKNKESYDNSENNNTINTYKEIKKKISQSSFNNKYEMYSGTQSKFFIESLLDNVVTNNKKNKEMLVTIIYNDKSTTDPEEIINIKHSLDDKKKYEIKLDYDDDGYVNKITIENL